MRAANPVPNDLRVGPSPSSGTRVGHTDLLHLLVVYLVWGSTYLAMRVAVLGLPPFLLASLRFATAGTILVCVARLRRDPVPDATQLFGSGLMGMFLLLGGNGMVVWAEQWISSGLAALLIGTLPLFTVMLEAVGAGQSRPTPRMLGALGLGFAGLMILLLPDLTRTGHGSQVTLASGAVLLASLSWATGTWLGRRMPTPESNLMRSGTMMLVASLALIGVSTWLGEPTRVSWEQVPMSAWSALLYLVLAGSCLGFTSFSHLTRHADPALAASYAYVNPVVAVLLGAWLLHEPLGWATVCGACGIVTSIVWLVRGNTRG
ncbi:MAG: EamA family transporter [bacterium]|nr:EamA family transporter [bacterium]